MPDRTSIVIGHLRRFCASGHHQFWPATVSLRDEALFVADAARGHRQLTDLYLLGLAKKMGGALATFDRTVPLAAVKGIKPDHLAVIGPGAE